MVFRRYACSYGDMDLLCIYESLEVCVCLLTYTCMKVWRYRALELFMHIRTFGCMGVWVDPYLCQVSVAFEVATDVGCDLSEVGCVDVFVLRGAG